MRPVGFLYLRKEVLLGKEIFILDYDCLSCCNGKLSPLEQAKHLYNNYNNNGSYFIANRQ
jgi:hypothetical protein